MGKGGGSDREEEEAEEGVWIPAGGWLQDGGSVCALRCVHRCKFLAPARQSTEGFTTLLCFETDSKRWFAADKRWVCTVTCWSVQSPLLPDDASFPSVVVSITHGGCRLRILPVAAGSCAASGSRPTQQTSGLIWAWELQSRFSTRIPQKREVKSCTSEEMTTQASVTHGSV